MKPIALLMATGLSTLVLAGCASNVARSESLSRYDLMREDGNGLVPALSYVDSDAVGQITAIYLDRASVGEGVIENSGIEPEDFERVVSTLSGTMCRRLARGDMEITGDPEAASHRLRLTITGFEPTNSVAAGASGVIGAFVPGPLSPRIPVGIGALAAEGELLDQDGQQIAAMQYDARNHLASSPGTISILTGGLRATADAQELAQGFADRFGDLIVEARDQAGGPEGETSRGTCSALFGDAEEADAQSVE